MPLSHQPAAGPATLDFERLFRPILRRAWVLILCVILGGAAAAVYVARSPKIYAGREVVEVAQEAQQVIGFKDTRPEDYKSSEVLKTIEQTLSAGSLLLRVAQVNHLVGNPTFLPARPDGSRYSDAEIMERMAGKVSVSIRRGTRLIDIVVEDRDPVLAAQLARSLAEEYRRQTMDQKEDAQRGANGFLVQEERRLKEKLTASERELADYRQAHQAVSLDDKQNIVVEKLRELSAKVTDAKSRRLQWEADLGKMQPLSGRSTQELLTLSSINSAPSVSEVRRQINEKEAVFAAIKERYGPKHIKYIEANQTLQRLNADLTTEVGKAAAAATTSYQAAVSAEKSLEDALHEQEKISLELDSLSIPYHALVRQAESDRSLYENVLNRMKETGVAQSADPDNLRVIESATVQSRPVKPSRLRTLALGLVAGAALGVALALFLEWTNHSLQTVDEAENALRLTLLAAVPALKRARVKDWPLLPKGAHSQREAFRGLRTTLDLSANGKNARCVLFTSAIPGEGKSFCSVNYAAALAQQGRNTLLINGDLRRPCGYESALLKDNAERLPGLVDCLRGDRPLAETVHPTAVENLSFCPAGSLTDEAAELVSRPRFASLLAEAAGLFDCIVIDTPPVNAVTDSLAMAPHAGVVCLVVRPGWAPLKAVLRCIHYLTMAGAAPAGFVFNRLVVSAIGAKSAYYYYGSEYHQPREDRAPASRGA